MRVHVCGLTSYPGWKNPTSASPLGRRLRVPRLLPARQRRIAVIVVVVRRMRLLLLLLLPLLPLLLMWLLLLRLLLLLQLLPAKNACVQQMAHSMAILFLQEFATTLLG